MQDVTQSAFILPSELLECEILEKLLRQPCAGRKAVQLDLFGKSEQELEMEHDRVLCEIANYLVYN